MPTIDEIFPKHASSNDEVAWGGRGNLPQERATYSAKRRQMDLDLIYDNWNTLPQDALDGTVNISNVPKKIQKRYSRAVKVHYDRLLGRDTDWQVNDGPLFPRQKVHSLGMLEDMQKLLPNHGAKKISDLPLDSFRSEAKKWDQAEDKGLTILRYWQYYRAANYVRLHEYKPVTSLRYINEGLSLMPPLQRGELPHKMEVLGRLQRYYALADVGEEEQAHAECRAILAAVRLLHFEKRVDMYDSSDILIGKLDILPHQFIKRAVKLKMKEEGACRPYFSRDERLGLMKELGIGTYSAGRYQCHACGRTKSKRSGQDRVKELSLCSGCAEVWYCSVECSKKGWKGGHKQQCGSLPIELPIKLSRTGYMKILGDMMTGICIIDNKGGDYVLALAQDGELHEDRIIYDVLSDNEIAIEEDENGASGSMEEMFDGLGFGGGLFFGGLGRGSSGLSANERMTRATASADAKSGMSAKELHDTRAACGDWLQGLSKVPYNKKWPDDF
ncbi:hypothetical protein ACHAXT_001691 [Thalassiosira profunda]